MKQIRIIDIQFLQLLKASLIAVVIGLSVTHAQVTIAQETPPVATESNSISEEASPGEPAAKSPEGKLTKPAPVFSSGYLAQTIVGLVFVVLLMFGLLWFMKRAGLSPGHRANGFYKVLNVASLGPKEKIALIEVGDTWLVVGMTQHSINTLHTMPKDSLDMGAPAAKPAEAFARMLEKLKTPQAKA